MPEVTDKYEVRQKAMRKKLESMASKSTLLKKISRKENKQFDSRCEIARKIFWEALEEYEEGDLTWESMINEISKSLKALKA